MRAAVYMAALSSARHDPQLRLAYKTMREEGKPAKVALIAVARKVIVLANSLVKQGRKYNPDYVEGA